MRRRSFLGLLGVSAMTALSGCAVMPSVSAVDDQRFDRRLTIPPLAGSRVENGTRVFELTAAEGRTEFLPGTRTRTWGFNGSYLGPTLRAAAGERVAIEVGNDLGETTSVHWHGMHLPAEMDGGPHQPVEPGGRWRPSWRIDQPAATLWYHPHPHGRTERHVYNGLAGLFIVDDAGSAAAGLPQQYGVDDVPVIVQDKNFTDDGQLDPDSDSDVGLLGSVVMANGTVGAYHQVTTETIRLRILNASTARTYAFGFADREFDLVGTDGGLLPAPVRMAEVRLSPAERAEIVVRMRPGERTRLHSFRPDLGRVVVPFAVGGKDAFDVLELRAADTLRPSEAADLAAVTRPEPLAETDAVATRQFVLSGRKINGLKMDMSRIDETVTLGNTEIWEVRNTQPSPHNFHVHDAQFAVLDIDGDRPPAELSGRKDTIYLEPWRRYRLIMKFTDYADRNWPYMYHCHLLQHEDAGMMGQFVVVEPGQQAGTPPETGNHEHDRHGSDHGSPGGAAGDHEHGSH